MRERRKAKLRDMTMIPSSLRAWESAVERQVDGPRVRRPSYRAAPRVAPPQDASDAEPRLSPYEMRKFLKQSQHYMLAVKKEPFAVGPSIPGGLGQLPRQQMPGR